MKTKIFLIGILLIAIIANVNAIWSFKYSTEGLFQAQGVHNTEIDYSAVVIKNEDTLCYLYTNTSYGSLTYECYNKLSDSFITKVIDTSSAIYTYDLAVDISGKAHVCFVYNTKLYYAFENNADFTIDNNFTVTGAVAAGFCSITTDNNNKPHIIYQQCSSYPSDCGLKEKFLSSDVWVTTNSLTGVGIQSGKINIIGTKKHISTFSGNLPNQLTLIQTDTLDSVLYNSSTLGTVAAITGISTDLSQGILYIASYNSIIKQSLTNNLIDVSGYDVIVNTGLPYGCSLGVYHNILYCAVAETTGIKIYSNQTGSWTLLNTFGDNCNTYLSTPTLKISHLSGTKWLIYTALYDGKTYIKVGYESNTFSVNGFIKNGLSLAPIYLADVCFRNIDVNVSFCTSTNPEGNFSISGLSYSILGYDITASVNPYIFGEQYQTQVKLSYVLDETTINNPIPFYLYPSSFTNGTSNLAVVRLNFLEENYPNKPIPNLNVVLKFLACNSGCPSCCSFTGNVYPFVTNINGQIVAYIPRGEYELSFLDNYNLSSFYGNRYLFWDLVNLSYTDKMYLSIDTPLGFQTFYVKTVSSAYYLIAGVNEISPLGIPVANVTISVYNNYYYFSGVTNESGLVVIPIFAEGEYTTFAHKLGYKNSVFLTSFDYNNPIRQHLYFVSKDINETFKLSGIVYDYDNKIIEGVSLTIFSFNNINLFNVTSDNNGNYEFVNIPLGVYSIIALKSDYTYTSETIAINGNITHNIYMQNISQITSNNVNGTVSFNNTKVQYAKVILTPDNNFDIFESGYFSSKEIITDVNGKFQFTNIRSDKCYNLKVTKLNYQDYNYFFCMNNADITIDISLTEGTKSVPISIYLYDCADFSKVYTIISFYTDEELIELKYSIKTNDNISVINIEPNSYYIKIITPYGYSPIAVKYVTIRGQQELKYCFNKNMDFNSLTIYYYEEDKTTIISDVKVIITNYDNNSITYSGKSSNRDGSIYFNLPIGKYTIRASKNDYIDDLITDYGKSYYELNQNGKLVRIMVKSFVTTTIPLTNQTGNKIERDLNSDIAYWFIILIFVGFGVYILVLLGRGIYNGITGKH